MSCFIRLAKRAAYFLEHQARWGYRFVDGGIWANNPIMIGLVDALPCFELDPTQVRILGLGCGREPVHVG
jgi:hypothetical protein